MQEIEEKIRKNFDEAFEQSLGEEVIDKEQDIEPDADEFDDEGK